MTRLGPVLLLASAALALAGASGAHAPVPGECSSPGGSAPSRCLYRSLIPSAGIVADCRHDRSCRVGYYYGDPGRAEWFTPAEGLETFPKPQVSWLTPTFAHVRLDCGHPCSVSYFFEAKRRRLSPPRRDVLEADVNRLLYAAVEGRALVVRQMFSGREVLRLERDWAPDGWLGDALTEVRFDPDGRLSFTWRRGREGEPVSERITVPSMPR